MGGDFDTFEESKNPDNDVPPDDWELLDLPIMEI